MGLRRPFLSVEQAKRQAAGLPMLPAADDALNVTAQVLERGIEVETGPEKDPPARPVAPDPYATGPTSQGSLKPPVKRRRALEPVFAPSIPTPRVQVFVSAVLPLPRTSRIFDQLIKEHPPAKSLQMILRRAMDDYELLLETGAHKSCPTDYLAMDGISPQSVVQTSRMIRQDLLLVAKSCFDPLGLESARTFGRKLATAALATFFENEGDQGRNRSHLPV